MLAEHAAAVHVRRAVCWHAADLDARGASPAVRLQLEITSFVSSLIYFGYMAIISLTFFLITGSIGFIVCLEFVRRIYGAIKVD